MSGAPFGPQFQAALLRILLADGGFARPVMAHIGPDFFTLAPFSWAWRRALQHHARYQQLPSIDLLIDFASREAGDPANAALYCQTLEGIRTAPLADEAWLRDRTLDFVRRNIFQRTFGDCRDLYQAGKFDAAYDVMQQRMQELHGVSWDTVDRGWLAEEFSDRVVARQKGHASGVLISTGIPALDRILEGGAPPGFLGAWLARPKAGKSSLLVALGATALRAQHKRVLHIVLEGSRRIVEDRYDANLTGELYAKLKRGDIDARKHAIALREIQYLKRLCVIRAFTSNWDTNAQHIRDEMRDLRQNHNWDPELIVVDYADLLRGRRAGYHSVTEEQNESFRDVKTIANQGYAVWTACQVQRPGRDNWQDDPGVLTSRDIAEAYGKIRVADFFGSINQTSIERDQGYMRLYAELYRDGPANQIIPIHAQFDRMSFSAPTSEMPPIDALAPARYGAQTAQARVLGYRQQTPGMAQ